MLATTAAYGIVVAAVLGTWIVYEPVRVSGGSMRPALVNGDVAIVRRHAAVTEGDIVLVRAPGRMQVLHRVVSMHEDGTMRLKGDANPVADLSDVRDADVAGPVVRVLPFGALLERWRGR